MKLLFSGGGTLGPVTPLIAIIDEIKKSHSKDEIFWVSTKNGKENEFLRKLDIKIYSIASAKLRRYLSVQNIFDVFRFIKSLFESYKIIKKIKPDIIISAGGYVSVAPVIVGRLLKIKIFIHQQDIQIGLANKIMSFFADTITVSFEEQLRKFKNKNVFFTGNPCRFTKNEIEKLNKESLLLKHNLKKDKPIVLILGGSSGAESLNNAIYNSIDKLAKKCQIIHVTGTNKGSEIESDDYMQIEFLKEEAIEFFYLSDIIISRAGLGTLTELSSMEKCSIIVPLLGHQEKNAEYFYKKNAVEIANSENFIEKLFELLNNRDKQIELGKNIKKMMPNNSSQKIIEKIYESR